jgi:hypothetical protein
MVIVALNNRNINCINIFLGDMGIEEAKAFDKVFNEQNPPEFIFERLYNPKNKQVDYLTTHKGKFNNFIWV